MFFEFCSDKEYDSHLWPLIWDLEVAIQTLIMEDPVKLRSYSSREFADKAIASFRDLYGDLPVAQERWTRRFIQDQGSFVRSFLADREPQLVDEDIPAAEQGLLPRSVLDTCMECPDFSTHILVRKAMLADEQQRRHGLDTDDA